jgi:hypothetical protein
VNKAVWLEDGICGDERCSGTMNNALIYRDDGHLSGEVFLAGTAGVFRPPRYHHAQLGRPPVKALGNVLDDEVQRAAATIGRQLSAHDMFDKKHDLGNRPFGRPLKCALFYQHV